MELNKKTMTIGVVLTLLCVAVGVVCLAVRPTTFTWIMFAVILALAIFQAVTLWYFAKKIGNETKTNEQKEEKKENEQEVETVSAKEENEVSNNNE